MKNKTIEKILLDFDPEEKNLLLALKTISANFGYIDFKQAQKIAEYFSLPLSQIFETGSFYDEIKFKKPKEMLIEVCSSPSCAAGNSLSLISEIENYFKIKIDDENNSRFQLRTMSCLGMCAEGPIIRINGKIYTQVNQSKLREILEEYT